MGVTLLRDTPSYFAYFGEYNNLIRVSIKLIPFSLVGYEGIKRLFQSMKKDGELGTFELLMAGGLSGFAAWIPAYPQDVIKSNFQNDLR
jgi:solute carrier family 25 carnitine/acylcarnitine transporter 20/29